jgi:hypothetical protein
MVMEATDFGHRDDFSEVRRLHGAWFRTIHPERQMRAPAVVIGEVSFQRTLEVTLVQDDHMIKDLAADTSNQSFHIGILPRRPWCNHDLFDAYVPNALTEHCPVATIAISEQIPRGLIPGEGFHDLLRGSLGGGMLGHMEMHDVPSLMSENQQHEEHLGRHRRHHEEIKRHQIRHVIVQKCLPRG